MEPGDESLEATAVRETCEELSLDLREGQMLGRLDDLAPRSPQLPLKRCPIRGVRRLSANKKIPRSGVCRCGVFGVSLAALGSLSQAFASAPHRLLPRRSTSPTGSTRRTGNARRNAAALGLTSVLAVDAMDVTDKLKGKQNDRPM